MAAQAGLCLAWLETPEDTFSYGVARLFYLDVDECEQGTSTCDSLCQNTIGSYRCACQTGYVLNRDGKTCRGELIF